MDELEAEKEKRRNLVCDIAKEITKLDKYSHKFVIENILDVLVTNLKDLNHG